MSLQSWIFVTLKTIAHHAPQSVGISRQKYWSRQSCLSPRNLPYPGIEPASLTFPALAGILFTTRTTSNPLTKRYNWGEKNNLCKFFFFFLVSCLFIYLFLQHKMKTNILCMKITSCLAKTDVLRNLICIAFLNIEFLISVGTDKNNNGISFNTYFVHWMI